MRIVTVLFLTGLIMTACKKGPDDPAISLRTRKARLTGTWSMQKGHVSLTDYSSNSAPFNSNFEFDPGNGTLTQSGTLVAYILKYNLSLTFKKDGSLSLMEHFDTYDLSASGSWNFASGVGKRKNKEDIYLKISNVSNGDTQEHLVNNFSTEIQYQIKELRENKLVIYAATKLYMDAYGTKGNFEAEYTFTKN